MTIRMRIITALIVLFFAPMSFAEQTLPAELVSELQSLVKMKEGDVVYVDFWASWCAPCRKSFPWMNAMQEKYEAKGLKVLAVNVDKERPLADEFLKNVSISFPIYYDTEGRLAKAFKLQGMPSSFILDDKGNIKVSHKGFFENKTDIYEQELIKLFH